MAPSKDETSIQLPLHAPLNQEDTASPTISPFSSLAFRLKPSDMSSTSSKHSSAAHEQANTSEKRPAHPQNHHQPPASANNDDVAAQDAEFAETFLAAFERAQKSFDEAEEAKYDARVGKKERQWAEIEMRLNDEEARAAIMRAEGGGELDEIWR